jgi:dynein heavy chain
MAKLEPMYQFSLEFYVRIFRKAIKTAEKPAVKNIRVRVNNITETLKRVLYTEVSRSIFVKHKSLYAFMVLISWLDSNGLISSSEL